MLCLKSLLVLCVIMMTSTALSTRSGKYYSVEAYSTTKSSISTSDHNLNNNEVNVNKTLTGGGSQSPTLAPRTPTTPVTLLHSEEGGNVFRQGTHDVPVEPVDDCECVPYYQCSVNRTIIENGDGLIDIRMKEGPCDYLEVCCGKADILSPKDRVTPSKIPAINTCGRRNFNGVSGLRIMGAEDNEAQFGEFPWMVAITKKVEISPGKTRPLFKCGGSLIHPQVVLTAAHCVKRQTGLKVRVGEWDTQRKTEPLPTQTRAVRDVIIHKGYHAGSLSNDIALLILEAPVEITENVATVCLPQQGENMDNRLCVATGWGKNVFGKEGNYQVILKKVDLPIVPKASCEEALRRTRLGRNYVLQPSFICAGGQPGEDTCKGDGGGPLVCPDPEDPSTYVQAGIVSWGVGCGSDIPGIYADVAYLRNWIDREFNKLNL